MNTLPENVSEYMECVVTETMANVYEIKCHECDKRLRVGEIADKRNSRTGTHYYCERCQSKWG